MFEEGALFWGNILISLPAKFPSECGFTAPALKKASLAQSTERGTEVGWQAGIFKRSESYRAR